jgi:N-methylhydantoinase A
MTRVGVDVGGTFTDLVAVREGELHTGKVPTTPDAPEEGVVDALRAAGAVSPPAVEYLGHGTTVATNAVLEGEWVETGLVTTEGFRDALEIGRQHRPDVYDFHAEKPDPVVPRDRRIGVPGRLDERGRELDPLDEDAVRAAAADLRAAGVESVAVCLLFAFENDVHERRAGEVLREELDCPVSLSSRVLPEIREYERTLATALNAALTPVLERYLGRLEDRLADLGVGAPLSVMQSSGATFTAADARERPVNTLLSGPAAGVRGAAFVAERAGFGDLLTMDMGGTSCDVSLVTGGDPEITTETAVGDYPVGVPAVDVHTVGSGGGSVAWVDAGGALRVGPRSAGADPGPVCYGRGGERPTVTDAHAVLGRIDSAGFLDDPAPESRVREAFEPLIDAAGGDVEAAARGVLAVANATMERALRVVSVERGRDPRDFTLVAFGGAGPLHASALAAELGVPRVLVPRGAGVLSALGLLAGDVVYDRSTSMVRAWEEIDAGDLESAFADLAAAGRDRLAAAGVPPERRTVERRADLRYRGQSFDLAVEVGDPPDLGAVAERFHDRHRERYGYADPGEPLELVTVRVRARGAVDPPDLAPAAASGSVADAVVDSRPVGFGDETRETRIYDRSGLPAGAAVDGPAIVAGAESTVAVPPGQRAEVDPDGNLLLEVAA